MKVLIVCGLFAKENEEEVLASSRRAVEFSANEFQRKIVGGFRRINCDTSVISAPFIPPFPTGGRVLRFSGFRNAQNECEYVHFLNAWGARNISRSRSLKKSVEAFAKEEDPEKLILVYSPHTPFLEAAVHAKRLDPRIHLCLYVPDLPEYMNLSVHRGRLYSVAKKIDIARMRALMAEFDLFVLLTESMRESLPIEGKPYLVFEGIVDVAERVSLPRNATGEGEKYIVYTGKLDEVFGAKDMVDSLAYIPDEDVRMILCGRGDAEGYIRAAAERDTRIIFLGQVVPEVARAWQDRASVLVNPRPNNRAYTKYSFPSKNIEYLLTGKPVVAYMLDGMPDIYRSFIYEVNSGGAAPEQIARSIRLALGGAGSDDHYVSEKFRVHAERSLFADKIAASVLDLAFCYGR